MRVIMMIWLAGTILFAGQYDKVKITPALSYLYVYHKGKAVKIHRIQDTAHKLTGEYAKIYRPDTFIQPIKMRSDIQTIGEVELLQFMRDKANKREGLVVDLRSKEVYQKESIPSAVNIPYATTENKKKIEKILTILGAKRRSDGSLDARDAMEIAFYCNGLWCDKSSKFIESFLALGYPADKMFYYRGGFQMWKILGFTTVTND